MKAMKIVGGVIGVILLLVVIGMGSLFSHYKTAEKMINGIEAQHVANKSNYDNMWKSFQETAQAANMQADNYKELFDGVISGRYEDSNPLFSMIQEDNPTLDGGVYIQLQQVIESGRKTFDDNQKKITDKVREYNNFLVGKFILVAIRGYDEMDANDFIVTSVRTEKAFVEGKDDVIDLNGDN